MINYLQAFNVVENYGTRSLFHWNTKNYYNLNFKTNIGAIKLDTVLRWHYHESIHLIKRCRNSLCKCMYGRQGAIFLLESMFLYTLYLHTTAYVVTIVL
jgi:hypothetical protein